MDISQLEVEFCRERGVTSFVAYAALPDDERRRRDAEALDRYKAPIRAQNAERTARIVEMLSQADEPASVSQRLRYEVLRRDDYRCQLCGRGSQDDVILEVDHKIARARGGSNHLHNLWTLCRPCNRGKTDLDL